MVIARTRGIIESSQPSRFALAELRSAVRRTALAAVARLGVLQPRTAPCRGETVDVDVRVLWDATTASIALRFGDAEPQGGRWVAIADKVFACVGAQQTLIELRFADVRIVTGSPS